MEARMHQESKTIYQHQSSNSGMIGVKRASTSSSQQNGSGNNGNCLLSAAVSGSSNMMASNTNNVNYTNQDHLNRKQGNNGRSSLIYGANKADNKIHDFNDQMVDTAFDHDHGLMIENHANNNSISLNLASADNLQDQSLSLGGGFGDPQLNFNSMAQEGQGQGMMQGQGQGFQSQNASSIMQHNVSMNDFGFIDEPSAIVDALDRVSSDEIQPIYAPHQSQTSQSTPLQVEQSRSNQQPNQTRATDPLAEVNSLKHVLSQLQQALSLSQQQVHPQIHGMLQAALKHQSNLHEALQVQKLTQNDWRKAFKEKVRVKLNEYKEQKRHELHKAEELKFKQQINEFELHERVSSLEQAYSRQEEEINKQANANEILKFEKMKLIQQHSKRLVQIENALGKIQIQKQPQQKQLKTEDEEIKEEHNQFVQPNQFKGNNQQRHVRGHSTVEVSAINRGEKDQHLGSNEKVSKPRQPPDSQSDKKRKGGEELSRSFCIGHRQDSLENENNQLKVVQGVKNNNIGSVDTQLSNLQNLVKEFKQSCDQQRRDEVQINDFQAPLNHKKRSEEGNESSGKQPSVSDCDFVNPNQKQMNNFFTSMGDASEANTRNHSSNDVNNRAVIMGGSKGSADHEDPDTALGDLAQQLNDTSFFAGQGGLGGDIQLPDNLNFFSKGNDEIEFHPNNKEESASKIRQIEDDMACFVEEDLLMSAFDESKQNIVVKKKPASNDNQDSDDKEVEDLFRDSSADSVADQLDSFKRQLNSKSQMRGTSGHKQHKTKSRARGGDVDLDDLMQASVATDFKPEEQKKKTDGQGNNFSKDFLNEGIYIMNEADFIPVQNKSSDKMSFSEAQININEAAEISLALPDLSAIISEKQDKSEENLQVVDKVDQFFNDGGSDDDENLHALNRGMMPNFILNVGEKQIKMPRLDLDRVLCLYDQNPFKGNIKSQTNQSLETDTILETHKDMKGVDASQTSGGSFLNETGSKQVQSECPITSVQSKQKESKSESDANMLDYLNKCDQAISAIIEDAPFDGDDHEIFVKDDIVCQATVPKKEPKLEQKQQQQVIKIVQDWEEESNNNMLDSLREEFQKEEQNRLSKVETKAQQQPSLNSPAPNSMPFELRDSIKSKLTDSNKMRQSSVVTVTYVHNNEKRSLSQVGQKIRQSSSVEEQNDCAKNHQLHPMMMQKNDFTMSQKEFDKKSQMMRLSELDSVSNHLHNKSQKEDVVTRTQKIGQMPATRKIIGVDGLEARNRAPSENQALERQQQKQKDSNHGGKTLSPHTMVTNGTDSIVGSLQTQSALGDKSRLSAPVTIPSKGQQRAQVIPRESAYMTEVVKEVEDDDSKILSVNNSSSKLPNNEETADQSIQMLAYNSAYPHTTKNIRQLKSHYSSQKQANQQQQPVVQNKKTKVSIQRVQHHAEMSSLIKNQKTSSSSIQRLKIVKKISVNSAAVPGEGKSEQGKREVLSSNSVERPSVGGNSSISLIEQSRIDRVNASSVNRDYASVGGSKTAQHQQDSSNPGLSINTRKSKPITVSFKNIVKASMQKRKASITPAPGGDESSVKRDNSEKPGSVINLQRVALNPAIAPNSSTKPGKISVAGKGDGKTLNITVMRNSRPRDHAESTVVKKQVLKLNNNNPNSSVEETRDGSIIFVQNRKNTVERVKPLGKRVPSPCLTTDGTATNSKDPHHQNSSNNNKQQRPSNKSKTKMLIAAHQIKQRKLSIGSANAAASLLKQNTTNNGSEAAAASEQSKNNKRERTTTGLASGSRAQTEASKVTSPVSPRRLSNKSAQVNSNKTGGENNNTSGVVIVDSHQNNHRSKVHKHEVGATMVTKPTKSVKKGSIICLKRRDVPVTEGSQHLSSSKNLAAKVVGERVASVGADGNQSSKRSQPTSDAPNLKIKRMTKSNNPKAVIASRHQSRGGQNNRPATVIRNIDSTVAGSQYASVNQTTVCGGVETGFGHDNSLLRELHTNQSNTILGDLSLLSKLGGGEHHSKGQIMVMPNLSYGANNNNNILINQQTQQQQQSSQQNLPSQLFYDGASMSTSFQMVPDTKSAAGGKRIGLSRGSIELTQNNGVNQSQVVAASSTNFDTDTMNNMNQNAATASGMQISQKAMKIISTQKSKISGAQRQVQMEWKTSGMQQSSNLQVGKHRHSAQPTTTNDSSNNLLSNKQLHPHY